MDRRQARTEIMWVLGENETLRNRLEKASQDIDTEGDPILAGDLRRYVDKLTAWIDSMYVWAGNI